MADGHGHGSLADARTDEAGVKRRLLAAFVLIGGYFFVELVGGLLTNSLALLSDAGHMFTDVLGLGMALAAMQVADRRGADPQRSFGLYRLEILAAVLNAVLLFAVAIWILVEAVQRITEPHEVLGTPMLVVGALGLAVNLVALRLLRPASSSSLNVEGAHLEVLADTLGSIGVVVAAVATRLTGIGWIDPAFALGIGLFVLPRTWRLGRRALRVLLQAAPDDVDMAGIAEQLEALDGVESAHDLHVWTLTSGMEVGSVHLRLEDDGDPHGVLDLARSILREDHGIAHATVQVEPSDHAGCGDCERTHW